MRIEEVYLDKMISIETDNLYMTALDVKDRIMKIFKSDEKKSEYETDGPRHKTDIVLVGHEPFNKFSKLKILFNLSGETAEKGFLNIKVTGSLVTKIDVGDGLMSQTFMFFYMEKIMPMMKSAAIRMINDVFRKVEKETRRLEVQI